jgi:hypothetical protein
MNVLFVVIGLFFWNAGCHSHEPVLQSAPCRDVLLSNQSEKIKASLYLTYNSMYLTLV